MDIDKVAQFTKDVQEFFTLKDHTASAKYVGYTTRKRIRDLEEKIRATLPDVRLLLDSESLNSAQGSDA